MLSEPGAEQNHLYSQPVPGWKGLPFQGLETMSGYPRGLTKMSEKPSYEELEQRVKKLENQIAEYARTLEGLKESEQQWRAVLKNAPCFIIITDRDGTVRYVNRSVAGLTPEDMIGKNIDEFEDAQYHHYSRQAVEQVFEFGTEGCYQVRGPGPDSTHVWYEIHFGPITRNGQIVAAIFISTEISERKQTEQALRESEQKYRLLIDNYGDPINVYDRNGVCLVMNPAAAENLGGKPEDFIGRHVKDYLPDQADAILERNRKVIESGKGASFEEILHFRSGRKWFWSNFQPVRDAKGKIYAVQVISYDITERKKTEEALYRARKELEIRVGKRTAQLVKANKKLQHEIEERKRLEKVLMQKEKLKTLGAIAAEVAHEIRNPLVSIGGFAQRLKQKHPELQECDIILSESKRLERILARIRSYLEPVEMHPQKCSVNDIINNCVHLLSPETKARKVKYRLNLMDDLSPAYVDPEILSQIFINLIRNATEAMSEGGDLYIRTFETGQDIQIEFKNRSPALRIDEPDILFMPFSEGGKSIGLPLCYRLLKEMGGVLSVAAENGFMVSSVSLPKLSDRQDEKTTREPNNV